MNFISVHPHGLAGPVWGAGYIGFRVGWGLGLVGFLEFLHSRGPCRPGQRKLTSRFASADLRGRLHGLERGCANVRWRPPRTRGHTQSSKHKSQLVGGQWLVVSGQLVSGRWSVVTHTMAQGVKSFESSNHNTGGQLSVLSGQLVRGRWSVTHTRWHRWSVVSNRRSVGPWSVVSNTHSMARGLKSYESCGLHTQGAPGSSSGSAGDVGSVGCG